MAEKKTESALVTGRGASNNPHLNKVLDGIAAGYKPHRLGKSNRQIRIDHTAMIPNERPVWGFKDVEQGNGVVKVPVLLFRAGWYLSPEENHMKEQLLAKGTETLALNKEIWKQMEAQGLTVEKDSAEMDEAKVVT